MREIYHGSDNPAVKLLPVKVGFGYHAGSGPVEFLGPSFSNDIKIASSYGKYIYIGTFNPERPKIFKDLGALKRDIEKSFGRLKPGDQVSSVGAYYKDIADSYRIKLLSEGFDAVQFSEGEKSNTAVNMAVTIIPISEDLPKIRRYDTQDIVGSS